MLKVMQPVDVKVKAPKIDLDIDQNHQRTLCGDIDLDVDAKSRAPKVKGDIDIE